MKLSPCSFSAVLFAVSSQAFTSSPHHRHQRRLFTTSLSQSTDHNHIGDVVNGIRFLNATDLAGSTPVIPDLEISEASKFDVSMLEFVPTCNSAEECNVDLVFSLMKEQQMTNKEQGTSYPYVDMIRGSAPYIANHRGELAVIHIPGDLLQWDHLTGLMNDISLCWLLGMKIVVVVGCRKQVNDRLAAMGMDAVLKGHTRITTKDHMRIIEEEAGYARFEMERRLHRSLRCNLLTSTYGNVVSGNFFKAAKFGVVDGVDFQLTGRPRKLNVQRIQDYLQTGEIVLMTSVGFDANGECLNVNSEALAAFTAASLCANKLVFCSNKGCILRHKESKMTVQNFRAMDAKVILDHYEMAIRKDYFLSHVDTEGLDQAASELLVKIGWSYKAIQDGVERAHIIAPSNGALIEELFTATQGTGTCISEDTFESIHPDDDSDDFILVNEYEYGVESDSEPDWPSQVQKGNKFPWKASSTNNNGSKRSMMPKKEEKKKPFPWKSRQSRF